jgi:acetyl esterase/lipase
MLIKTPRGHWARLLTLAALAGAAAACGGGGGGDAPAPPPPPPFAACSGLGAQPLQTLAYRSQPGVPPALHALDLVLPRRDAGCPAAPLVVYFHGGGYVSGDKSQQVADKIALFTRAGWGFASVNYRLSPFPLRLDDPTRVRYPDAQNDAAAALRYLHDIAAAQGLDPSRFLLLGHSAGAHLTALVSADGRFVAAQGLPASTVRCVALLDTEAYDLPAMVGEGGDDALLYQNAIATDTATLREASPRQHVKPGLAPHIVVTRGTASRQAQAAGHVAALQAAGVPAQLLVAGGLSHAEVNQVVGRPGDTVVTPALMAFYEACAAR